jgi:hypothetical protein
MSIRDRFDFLARLNGDFQVHAFQACVVSIDVQMMFRCGRVFKLCRVVIDRAGVTCEPSNAWCCLRGACYLSCSLWRETAPWVLWGRCPLEPQNGTTAQNPRDLQALAHHGSVQATQGNRPLRHRSGITPRSRPLSHWCLQTSDSASDMAWSASLDLAQSAEATAVDVECCNPSGVPSTLSWPGLRRGS